MNIVVKNTGTMDESKHNRMLDMTIAAYNAHKKTFKNWNKLLTLGEPIKCWESDDCDICVEYENVEWFHYEGEGLRLPFPDEVGIKWW